MGALLGTLGFFSILFMAGALIKPEPLQKGWFKEKTRRKIILVFGLGGFILFMIGIAVTPAQNVPTPVTAAPQEHLTSQEMIAQTVNGVLSGNNADGEPYLRNLSASTSTDGLWDIAVDFNASQNLTSGLTLDGIKMKSTDLYQGLYTSGVNNIEQVIVSAYLPGMDRYGNTTDTLAYRSELDGDVAAKVNWNADKATLELQVLPGLWNTLWVWPALQQ